MTINLADNDPRNEYTVANGNSQTIFTMTFEIFDNADLNVYVDGTLQTLTTHYKISDSNTNANAGHTSGTDGFVHFTSAVSASGADKKVVLTRSINLERTTDFPASGAFQIGSLNTELDKIIAIQADLKDDIDRSLRLTDFDVDVALTLPNVDTRKGKTLAFNATSGVVEAGPSIADVQTVSAASADIATLADIEDGTDATDAIQTVAGISGNVTTVAGVSSDVSTVAGISANVTTVAGISANVTTVAGKASFITADFVSDLNTLATADVVSDLNTLATSAIVTDMDALANLTTELDALGDITSNITTVAGVASNVTTVAGVASNVTTVAGIASDVTTVAADGTDIGTVAGISSNVSTVAGNSTNVSTVAGISSNVSTLAAISSDITSLANAIGASTTYAVTVSGGVFYLDGASNPALTLTRGNTYIFDQSDSSNSGHPLAFRDSSDNSYTTGVTVTGTAGQAGAKVQIDIANNAPASLKYYCTVHGNGMGNSITVVNSNLATVASNITNVNNVGGSIANVNTVAGISANVTTVAGISANTTTVAGISSDVTSVAGVASNVTTVAGVSSDVTTVAGISANVTSVAGVASNVTTVAGVAANVTTVANNVAGVNSFAERYRVGSSDPTTSLDAGDLAYNTTDNALKYYNGSSWASITAGLTDIVGDATPQLGGNLDVNGNSIVSASNGNISITPNGSGKVIIDGLSHPTADGSAGQFITTDGSGTLSFGDVPAGVGGATGVDFNDNVTARFGTGNDLTLRHDSSDNNSYIEESGSGALVIKTNNLQVKNASGSENMIVASENGSVALRYDNSTKITTTSAGASITGTLTATNLNITDSTYGAKVQMTTSDTSNPVTAGTENNGQLAYLQNNKNLYLYQDNKKCGEPYQPQILM